MSGCGNLGRVDTAAFVRHTKPEPPAPGIGSQVPKPLAVVVVGGMALAPIVILITLPVLISLFSRNYRRSLRREMAQEPAE
jgi:cobalt-zinc-cadmium resistance protein CzcA